MSTTTTNLNMVLNEGQDKFSIPTLNENLTKIDTAIGEQNKNIELVHTFESGASGSVTVDLSKYKLFLMTLNNTSGTCNMALGGKSMLLPVLPNLSNNGDYKLSTTLDGREYSCSLTGNNISAMTFSHTYCPNSRLYGIK